VGMLSRCDDVEVNATRLNTLAKLVDELSISQQMKNNPFVLYNYVFKNDLSIITITV